jgi:hypothetical protein
MTLIYHGTNIKAALDIARTGSLMSPWDQEIEEMNEITREYGEEAVRRANPRLRELGLEAWALEKAKRYFGEHDWEHRVKRASLTANKGKAVTYAKEGEEHNGGIVLEFEATDEEIREKSLPGHVSEVIYWDRRIPLEKLRSVLMLPVARILREGQIRKAYSPYRAEVRAL